MFAKMTGRRLAYTCTGKPTAGIFGMAQHLIQSQLTATGHTGDVDTIYMIGDNPRSDIRGANAMGTPWVSVLVRTGNFRGAVNDDIDPAQLVVSDAPAAVDHILQRHRQR